VKRSRLAARSSSSATSSVSSCPVLQGVDARRVDVEAEHGPLLAEFDGQRQADVAQADVLG
jgi:hypothetical protein